ncbi:hypothetical protein DEO72_LG4g1401 [Vigna unguiculata]|uniref:Uncharacterized protein n=1 Tax=Vigna unguiculata TaxID=3917 RepID=A0A4D6LPV5_VIGUN|nr:hypothetical protein DEO72_LG4g1401 [Vigna unguiculata]
MPTTTAATVDGAAGARHRLALTSSFLLRRTRDRGGTPPSRRHCRNACGHHHERRRCRDRSASPTVPTPPSARGFLPGRAPRVHPLPARRDCFTSHHLAATVKGNAGAARRETDQDASGCHVLLLKAPMRVSENESGSGPMWEDGSCGIGLEWDSGLSSNGNVAGVEWRMGFWVSGVKKIEDGDGSYEWAAVMVERTIKLGWWSYQGVEAEWNMMKRC